MVSGTFGGAIGGCGLPVVTPARELQTNGVLEVLSFLRRTFEGIPLLLAL